MATPRRTVGRSVRGVVSGGRQAGMDRSLMRLFRNALLDYSTAFAASGRRFVIPAVIPSVIPSKFGVGRIGHSKTPALVCLSGGV